MYSQKEGIDFTEVFSNVVKHTFTRALLAVVSLFDLELEQLNVKTTFTWWLKETIYMDQPKIFILESKEIHACRLSKSFYG